jgi:hypothetical protein
MEASRYTDGHICACILGVLFCYLPLYLGVETTSEDLKRVQDTLDSAGFRTSTEMAVAITFPMLMDSFFELQDWTKKNLQRYIIRWIYIFALLLPNGLLLVPFSNKAVVYLCSMEARDCLFYGALFSLLSTQRSSIKWEIFSLGVNVMAQVVANMYIWWNFTEDQKIFQLLTVCFAVAVFVCLIGISALFFLDHFRKLTKSNYDIMVAKCIVVMFLNCVVKWVLFLTLGSVSFTAYTPLLIGYIWTEIATYIVTFSYYSRVLRDESLLLRSKLKHSMSFMAHLSHEIRTPLNAISLGMQMMFKRISTDSDAAASGRAPLLLRDAFDDLCCVDVATSTALQTLNELLTFDKLASRSLTVDMQPIRVIDLVRMAAGTFRLQVQFICSAVAMKPFCFC